MFNKTNDYVCTLYIMYLSIETDLTVSDLFNAYENDAKLFCISLYW